jgi:hypothetical protein
MPPLRFPFKRSETLEDATIYIEKKFNLSITIDEKKGHGLAQKLSFMNELKPDGSTSLISIH